MPGRQRYPSYLAPFNASYWDHGFPAIMISDTADFRNPHYHQASDLPETLDFSSMARAVLGLSAMLGALGASD